MQQGVSYLGSGVGEKDLNIALNNQHTLRNNSWKLKQFVICEKKYLLRTLLPCHSLEDSVARFADFILYSGFFITLSSTFSCIMEIMF